MMDMVMAEKKKKNPELFETKAAEKEPRAEGSGRRRIIEENPGILTVVRSFTETAGVAAHRRRHDESGRFGFTIKDVHDVVKEKLFKNNPNDAPSEKTLRRLFEPPSKAARSQTYYKSYISARPGTKSNCAPAGGERHPHQHECFSMMKIIRLVYHLSNNLYLNI